MSKWLTNNREWVFSGIGVAIITTAASAWLIPQKKSDDAVAESTQPTIQSIEQNNQDNSGDCSPNMNISNSSSEFNCDVVVTGELLKGESIQDRGNILIKEIEYSVAEPQLRGHGTVLAKVDGQTYEVLSDGCFRLAAQKDFDGNGSTDALVSTCSDAASYGASFSFISYGSDGHFHESDSFGYSWDEAEIEEWKGEWSAIITSDSAGYGNTKLDKIRERYILSDGEAIKVGDSSLKGLQAIVEFESEVLREEYLENQRIANNAPPNVKFRDINGDGIPDGISTKQDTESPRRQISYDLNDDGIEDRINMEYWDRWGAMAWDVEISNAEDFDPSLACKRIGVLASKNNGFNDIVCNQNRIYSWNGSTYEANQP